MKSPFLVAAQMKMQEEHTTNEKGVSLDRDESSSSSSSSLSSSVSSLSSGSATPSKKQSANATIPSSTASTASATKKSRKNKKQQQSNNTHLNRPDVDMLPGSILLDDDDSPPSATPTPPRASTPSPSSSSALSSATASVMKTTTTSRPYATRSERESERARKAKRWSNGILITSALPIIGALVYDHLYPATAQLSTEHSRQTSWHLSTIASKCLHLSHQVPSSTSAVMNLIHLTTSTPLSSSNTQSTSSILLNALSTAPTAERYYKGFDDIYIVLLWVAIWTFFRESMIRFICGPIGRWGGIKKTAALQRFGEQGYDVVSHVLGVAFGTCIMQNLESGYRNLNMDGLWLGYPHYKLSAGLKAYYLIQMGFWLQQVLTLHLEKKRKDYGQMFLHHIITVSLLCLSYNYNFTYIGNVILILMDVSDIILGSAKMLKYLKFNEAICNVAFGLFMLSWIVTRHIYYPKVLWSIINDSERLTGRFEWDPEKEWYFSRNVRDGFIVLLGLLQVLLILWFFMIVRVAVGVLCGKPAGDLRSDDEGESDPTQSDELKSSPTSPSLKNTRKQVKDSTAKVINNVRQSTQNMSNGHANGDAKMRKRK